LPLSLSGWAGAQGGQPLEVVKIVTGFPPGGTSDTLCRRVAEKLRGGAYTKSALVDNKAGAGGQIAVQSMKGARVDGSIILQTPASMLMIYPHIYEKLAYDAFADVTAVALACTFDFGFCVGPAVPDSVKGIPEFLAWCKANPDKANYGSPVAGSVPHFIGMLLGQAGGIQLKHVAYRGSQPAIQDLVVGQLQAVSGPISEFTRQVNAGKARFLGVSGAARSRFAPGVPTFAERLQGPGVLRMVRLLRPGRDSGAGRATREHRVTRSACPERRHRRAGRDGPRVDVVDASSARQAPQGELRPLGPDREKDRFHADS
jgi:tripartite-type tricarboxylate transporter receptor subunit TctC